MEVTPLQYTKIKEIREMKKRFVKALLAMLVSVSIIGCIHIKTADSTAETDSYIDMNTVISYSGTANGLQLNFEAGTGYYLDIPQESDSLTEIFYICSEGDHKRLLDALENRNGKIIIEVSSGTVLDNEGNGKDSCGYYIKYDSSRFFAGDQVQSVFVYNPETNYIDDIVSRADTLIR